jgi:uncharacterized membrane protein
VNVSVSDVLWLVARGALLLFAAGMLAAHARGWRRLQHEPSESPERDYRRRQLRRRLQSTIMLLVLAVLLVAIQWVDRWPWVFLALLTAVLVLVAWVLLLAAADVVATRYHFGRIRGQYLMEEAKLHAEIRRLRAAKNDAARKDAVGGNGRPVGKPFDPHSDAKEKNDQ